MDFLKGIISDELFEKLKSELEGKEGVKLGNLADGKSEVISDSEEGRSVIFFGHFIPTPISF